MFCEEKDCLVYLTYNTSNSSIEELLISVFIHIWANLRGFGKLSALCLTQEKYQPSPLKYPEVTVQRFS